jgi:hypothetical protein
VAHTRCFNPTADQKHLVKSISRHSEHTFFSENLSTPYVQDMVTHLRSLLVHIYEFLVASGSSIGRTSRPAPSQHFIMNNTMYGRGEAKKQGDAGW